MSRHFAAAFVVAFGAVVFGSAQQAQAIPTLQLYIEGATYVGGAEESWVLVGPSTSFRLWAIGNLSKGDPITNVRLSAVYDTSVGPLTITLTPTTAGGNGNFMGFTDSSTPSTPVLIQTSSAGDTPTIFDDPNDNKPADVLSSHGQYGTGRTWQEFSLGDFTTSDSPIGDFVTSFPTPSAGNEAQINVYTVTVSKPVQLHFDLYGLTSKNNPGDFAPFSHDATGVGAGPPPPVVPEPGTFALLALGGVGLAAFRRRRKPVDS